MIPFRLRQYVRVEKIQNKRVLKQTLTAAREGIRKRGRPCKRWWDKAENNLNIMGINNRQAMARDSWEWGKVVLKAKVHNRY
jgi:hypothetical protein